MVQEINLQEALEMPDALFVDVRSPGEYQEDTIPGAINIPLLEDCERMAIGTLYHHQGVDTARQQGLEYVGPKLAKLVQQIMTAAGPRPVVIFCWRGGMRSKAVADVLALMGMKVYRLIEGYKSFRRKVVEDFGREAMPQTFFVLYGLTGTGKTEIINILAQRAAPAVDLEGLAGHRGSVFGGVGLVDQPTQKRFETDLWHSLQCLQNKVIVEGESRRIAKLHLPQPVVASMRRGRKILIYDTLASRINRILQVYAGADRQKVLPQLLAAVAYLRRRLGRQVTDELESLLYEDNWRAVVERLLVDYYDPLYQHPDCPAPGYHLTVNAANPETAAQVVQSYVDSEP